MARGSNLVDLLDQYRAECRLSLKSEHNVQDRDRQIMHLQRTQTWLWEDFDWPFLRVDRFVDIAAGQRFYSPPDDIKADRIQIVKLYYSGGYNTLKPGIDAEHYSCYDPTLNQRAWPPQRWRISEDNALDGEQLEVWPLPDQDANTTTHEGRLTITGIRNLRPFVAVDDQADLDDRLIVLFCASEVLASRGDKDAASKLQMANKRYRSLRGAQMPRKKFTLFGVGQSQYTRRERVPIAVYNKV